MKANELTIGDWVIHHYEDIGDTPEQLSVELFKYKDTESFIEGCDPIPITQEILENNGFVGNTRDRHLTLFDDEDNVLFTLSWRNGNFWIPVSFYGKGCSLLYVHELQHALRLCGLTELADNFKVKP